MANSIFEAGKLRLQAAEKLLDLGYHVYSGRILESARRALEIAEEAYNDLDGSQHAESALSQRRINVLMKMTELDVEFFILAYLYKIMYYTDSYEILHQAKELLSG